MRPGEPNWPIHLKPGSRRKWHRANLAQVARRGAGAPAVLPPPARVQTFTANVVLSPRLSIGTAAPESIYEARFNGRSRQ